MAEQADDVDPGELRMDWTHNWHMHLLWILLAILLAAALRMLIRLRTKAPDRQVESPEQVLRRRYAAGEIDQETYDHMLETLSPGSSRDGDETGA